ncbi:hypothetical protein PC116_g31509 [Phytophthora cactorum]|uniref:Uncharacterized protein n=1 Tax=Phytophthora cactorum TaxID=29920 RepID=A0A8T1J961_9STRA|nr:hypothetical protein PC114_g27891 [Phytophthora cactorum]KAG2877005.1 hypothetical protein PC117_g27149 [Phytophthora cactorum]KAG2958398.1 hypothetical protein PC119_g27023 [Phytophthora cactorum]KAG2964711.1 hypothetical protein PC120_g27348 [Phytophthora cactorum]KAG3113663.1 hypothetical protein C6341_g27746 [Phytophthora cactorum]
MLNGPRLCAQSPRPSRDFRASEMTVQCDYDEPSAVSVPLERSRQATVFNARGGIPHGTDRRGTTAVTHKLRARRL